MKHTLKFSKFTIGLHWIVAIGLIGMITLGKVIDILDLRFLMPIHKSIGMLLFTVILLRVIWRLVRGFPQPLETHKAWEVMTARITHWFLLIGSLLFPVSGMLMTWAGGRNLSIFGFELVAANPDPAIPGEVLARSEFIGGIMHSLHGFLGTAFIIVIVLHVFGALKHHFMDKDITLMRMLGK